MDDETRPIRNAGTDFSAEVYADQSAPSADITTPDTTPDTSPDTSALADEPTPGRRRRWLRPVAAGVGLVMIGGLGGFGIGHATAGGDQLTPTSFRGGPPGSQNGQTGQGGPGSDRQGFTPGQGPGDQSGTSGSGAGSSTSGTTSGSTT